MKNGGQIPWNALPICETLQISCLMGRRHMKDVLGSQYKGPIIPFGSLVEYNLSLRKTSQESINLERKYNLDCSLDTLCTWGEFGRVT